MKILITYILLFTSFSYSQTILNENTDVKENNNGTKTMTISNGDRYYKSPDSLWYNINNKWDDSTTYWIINRNKYNIRIKKQFKAVETFQFYLSPNDLTFEPDDIMLDSLTILHPVNVTGYLKDSNTIRFENCYGSGISYEINGVNGLHISEIIDSSVFLGYGNIEKDVPGGGVVNYRKEGNKSISIKFKLVEKNKIKEKTTKIKDWDYEGNIKKNKISLDMNKYEIRSIKTDKSILKSEYKLEKRSNNKYISKEIILNNYSSIKTKLSVDILDSTIDGFANRNVTYVTGWSDCRSGAGTGSGNTDTYINAQSIGNSTDGYRNYRAFMFFNINLPNYTILTASIKVTVSALYQTPTVHFVSHTNGTIDNSSYQNIDNTSFGNYSPTGTGVYNISFNSAGITYLQNNITGLAKIAMKNDVDLVDTPPVLSSWYGAEIGSQNNATVGNRPLLTLTYNTGTSTSTIVNKKAHIINMNSRP
jgi:hypothetical protein